MCPPLFEKQQKMCYMRHRRFLRRGHPYHNNKKAFDGMKETDEALKHRTGKQIYMAIKDIAIIHGKGLGATSVPSSGDKALLWKKKVNILAPTLLARLGCSARNRCYARGEKCM